MNLVGIVRRIDNLGRIVIPKEIRKVLKLKENEEVEIKVEDDKIILNKYSELKTIKEAINKLIITIEDLYNKDIIITDLNNIIYTSNKYKYLLNKEISDYLNNLILNRENINSLEKKNLMITNTYEINSYFIIKSIIINGDIYGTIIYLSDNINNDFDNNIVNIINNFFIKYLE